MRYLRTANSLCRTIPPTLLAGAGELPKSVGIDRARTGKRLVAV